MGQQFFIKRGEKINGPISVEKLQALKKTKKLKAEDEISQSAEGPWIAFCEVYEGIRSIASTSRRVSPSLRSMAGTTISDRTTARPASPSTIG